jgi:hypothetical protein
LALAPRCARTKAYAEKNMLRDVFRMVKDPKGFFMGLDGQGVREPLVFLLIASGIIAPFTAVANFLGVPSTDLSASLQAQIIAWRATEQILIPRFGYWAYVLEVPLVMLLTLLFAVLLAGFVHLLYRLLGGTGTLREAWKAVCYGVGPCVILGWIPYWSVFVASWALVTQLYFAPKVLYRVHEGRALIALAAIIAATLLEFAVKGTTIGFGPR